MQKWEYKIVNKEYDLSEHLNECGQDGWELTFIRPWNSERTGIEMGVRYYFKRPFIEPVTKGKLPPRPWLSS